LSLYFQHTDSR